MVRKLASTACALAAPALVISCQMVWGIEEKRLAPIDDAGPDASSPISVVPPQRPSGNAAPSNTGKSVTFAIRRLFLGTISPDTLETDAQRWSELGYDIDGKCTTQEQSAADNSGVCHKVDVVVSADSHTDGKGCRDNAGGHVLAGAFKSLENPEREMQALLEDGSGYTLVLQIDDLDSGADDAYAPGRLYVGSPRVAADPPRKWDGTDRIAVDSRSVINAGLQSPKVSFPTGYVKDHVWVSNRLGDSVPELPLPLFGAVSFAEARTATITLRLDATHQKVQDSVFSAAIGGNAFKVAVWPGLLLQAQCNDFGADTAFQKVQRNVDLADRPPTFVDPEAACVLMSMGMQPVWAPVLAPTKVVPERPAPDLCK